jgi:hypothetical protein
MVNISKGLDMYSKFTPTLFFAPVLNNTILIVPLHCSLLSAFRERHAAGSSVSMQVVVMKTLARCIT